MKRNILLTVLFSGLLAATVILPQRTYAFDLGDIFNPFGDDSPIPGLPLPPLPFLPFPGFNSSNNQPTTVNNTNINSNNINSNIQSPGAVINGATNVSATRGNASVRTIDSGYYVNQPTGSYPTPYPTYYPTPTPYTSNLEGSCYSSLSNIQVGSATTWVASAWGGTGSYSYSWNGTDGLSSGGNSVQKAYYAPGTKTASVTISSGNQTITRSCGSVYVHDNYNYYNNNYDYNYYDNNYYYTQPLQVSCGVTTSYGTTGSPVNWYSNVSGGNGNYQYYWSGTDGLSGYSSSLRTAYNYPGYKTATLRVTSNNGQSATANCGSVNITSNTPVYNNPISGTISCSANVASAQTTDIVTWSANVPNYGYSSITWGGTDNLYGTGNSLRTTYLKSGSKTAYIIVRMPNGQTATQACSNTVTISAKPYSNGSAKKPVVSSASKPAAAALDVMCMPSSPMVKKGDTVVWTANATGGNGTYKYEWTGSDDLTGTGSTVFKSYYMEGSKAAAVTVTSGSKSVMQTCATMVSVGQTANALFSLSNIPWGLISILVILVLLASIAYLLINRNKI